MDAREIDVKDIRVGDRVRAVKRCPAGETITYEGVVCSTDRDGYIQTVQFGLHETYTFTLLSRPEPPREPGSRWEDPETGARYVKTDDDTNIRYIAYTDRRLNDHVHLYGNDARIVARLIPLDDA